MASEEHYRKLERMYHGAAINEYFRPALRVRDGQAEVEIPIRPDFFHAAAAIHGSIYFKALDDAAFFAVNSVVEDVFVLTVSYTFAWDYPFTLKHQNTSLMLLSGKGSGAFSGPKGASSVASELVKALKPYRVAPPPVRER